MSIEPKKPTQRQLNALETRNKLFTTALKLFNKYGYNVVTVDDIVNKAGYSKGTFYANFKSKESILIEQFRLIDEHYTEVAASFTGDMSGSDRILELVKEMFYFCQENVGMDPLRVVYSSQISSKDTTSILTDRGRVLYKIMYDCVDLAKLQGHISSNTPTTVVAEDMLRVCRGLIYEWCMYGNDFDLVSEGVRTFKQLLEFYQLKADSEK